MEALRWTTNANPRIQPIHFFKYAQNKIEPDSTRDLLA